MRPSGSGWDEGTLLLQQAVQVDVAVEREQLSLVMATRQDGALALLSPENTCQLSLGCCQANIPIMKI